MGDITQKERAVLEESFLLYDTIGDGKIDINLLGDALRGLGLNPTVNDVDKIRKQIDPSNSAKRVSFDEFLPIYQSVLQKDKKAKMTNDDFVECFRVFDKDGTGLITAGELHHVLTTLGERLAPADIDLLTQGLENKQGQVHIEDFVRTVMEG
eukprot:gene17601-19354_t